MVPGRNAGERIDVGPLLPEAQPVALAAAEVYLRHTAPWLIGLLAHGSALKGGFIPGLSDLDMQPYLADEAFDADGRLPLKLGLAIQRNLAAIPLGACQYIQCYARPTRPVAGLTGPIPGAYHLLLGRLPVPEATDDDLRASARRMLSILQPEPGYLIEGMLTFSLPRLERQTRLLCTDVWPLLYSTLSLTVSHPIQAWRQPKRAAIDLLPADLRPPALAFWEAASRCYAQEPTPERLLQTIEAGVTFRWAVHAWWEAQGVTD